MRPRASQLAVAVVALTVLLTGVGFALTGGVGVDGTVPINDDDGPEVIVDTGGGEMALDGPSSSGSVQIIHDNGEATVSGPAGSSVRVDSADLTGTWTRTTSVDTNGGGITIDPVDKPAATVTGSITAVEFRDAALDDGTSDVIVTGDGNLTVRDLSASTKVVAVDTSGVVVDQTTTDSSGTATFETSAGTTEISLVTTSSPSLSGGAPSGGTVVSETPVDLTVNVTDGDFATTKSDTIDVTFYDAADDSILGTDTVTSNGTATAEFSEPDGGSKSWYAVAEDDYGNEATTATFSFNAPSEMRIYSETNPNELISQDVPLRVRFFIGENEGQVIERQATNGTVSLEGLPVDQRFIATVRANDTSEFTYRRVVVDSLIETQEVYLLNRSEPNSEIIYQLDDPTGEFPPETTVLYVEKPITKDFDGDGTEETQYQTIAGDVFGASAQFPVILQQDTRYRLRVESDGGSSRILGAYSVTGDAVEPLQIQRVQLRGEADAGAALTAVLEGDGQNRQIAIRYRDLAGETTAVEYRVVDQRTGEVYVENTTREAQQFADFYNLPENANEEESFAVEYTIERNGETRSGRVFAGDLPEVIDRFGLGDNILRVVSIVIILATMGLVVLVNPLLAPMAGTVMGGLLNVLGVFTIANPVLGIAGAISILSIIGGSRL